MAGDKDGGPRGQLTDPDRKPRGARTDPDKTRSGLKKPTTSRRALTEETAVVGPRDTRDVPTTRRDRRPGERPRSEIDHATGPGSTLADQLGMPALKTPVALLSLPGERPFDQQNAKRWKGYLLGEVLGEGGMGRVIASREVDLGRNVALKTLKEVHRKDEGFIRALVFEARLTGQLEHPNIVPVYEIGLLDDGTPYYTMQLVGDISLRDVLRQLREGNAYALRSYTLNRLLQFFRGICMAVEYAHARGVIHRDLKPDNVLIGEYGEVQLMDWGVARVLPHDGRPSYFAGRVEEPGVVVGTPHYMSPEQARGDTHLVDARSDIYSLGVILYQILTYALPYDTATTNEQLDALLSEPVPPPRERAPDRNIPRELERICLRALAARRDDRYPSARALWSDIEAFIEGTKEQQRLHELAMAQVVVADAAAERYFRISAELVELEREVTQDQLAARPIDPVHTRKRAWERQLKADHLRLVEARAFAEAGTGYQQALAYQPKHAGAREGLVALFHSQADNARRRGDDAGFVLYGDLEHNARGTTASNGQGTLQVRSYPEGAKIHVFDLEGDPESGRSDALEFGSAPTTLSLKPGSYLVSAVLPSYRESRLPVVITSGVDDHLLIHLTPWEASVPIVSRGDELNAMIGAFNATVADGRLGSMMVAGTHGVGKGKLLNDFVAYLDDLPQNVAYGVVRCARDHQRVPLMMLSEFIGHRAGIARTDSPAVILDKLDSAVRRAWAVDDDTSAATVDAEIHDVVRRIASLPMLLGARAEGAAGLSPTERSLAALDAVTAYMRRLARHMPIVLAIRGAHNLDRLSRDALFYLAESLQDTPLFCLMLATDDRLQLRCDRVLALAPLDEAQIQRQTELLLRGAVEPEVVAFIARISGGNAFFVGELVRILVARGWLQLERRRWTLSGAPADADLAALEMDALLMDTIASLSPSARAVLDAAAVFGRVFWDAPLRDLMEREVGEDIQELTENDIITPRPASHFSGVGEFSFRHRRLQELLYDATDADARRRGHRHLADWIEARKGDHHISPDLVTIAFMATLNALAGDPDREASLNRTLAEEAARWERDDVPAWSAWPRDLTSGLFPDVE